MKKLKFLFALIIFFSCSNDNDFETTILPQNDVKEENHFVSLNDVVTLQRAQTTETRSVLDNKFSVKCLKDETNDTLLYIVNHPEGGWTIYASDTRVPAILAQSSEGTYEEASENDNLTAWVGTMAEDMKIIKHLDDRGLNFTSDEIKHNQKFWKAISKPDEYIAKESTQTRRAQEPSGGKWELVSSKAHMEILQLVPALTKTKWNQNYPYNKFCPLKSNELVKDSIRVPAGCIAIAAAQMLYFLHYEIGVPKKAPSWATCDGNIDSYTMEQGGLTSDIWDKMYEDMYDDYAAPLIANIGMRINMKYGNKNSISYDYLLKDRVFSYYGISCDYLQEYNASILCQNLQNKMPVIIGAQNSIQTRSVLMNDKGEENCGHTFIADRYKYERQVTVNVYEWVYDDYSKKHYFIPESPLKTEYKYSHYNEMVGFNWGYGPDKSDDSQWFTLTGDWIREKNKNQNWNSQRDMIYNFTKK